MLPDEFLDHLLGYSRQRLGFNPLREVVHCDEQKLSLPSRHGEGSHNIHAPLVERARHSGSLHLFGRSVGEVVVLLAGQTVSYCPSGISL